MADLVTFGETMLRLSPPADVPLELADRYDVHVAGAESNVAVAAGRLGLETVWTSKLPDAARARRITGELRRHGVEPAVSWSDEGRVGTYYLERGDPPRGSTVTYDRDGAAVRSATPDELAVDRIEAARAVHTTGITPALSATLRETTATLLERAGEAGTLTSFDLNYRSNLWSPGEAREAVVDLLPHVDCLLVADRDAETVLDRDGDAAAVASDLAAEYDVETVLVTRGERGAVAAHDGERFDQAAFAAGDAYPIGSGDAFAGGYLARRLQDGSVPESLAWGAATAALKRTIPGDLAAVDRSDVERVIAGGDVDLSR